MMLGAVHLCLFQFSSLWVREREEGDFNYKYRSFQLVPFTWISYLQNYNSELNSEISFYIYIYTYICTYYPQVIYSMWGLILLLIANSLHIVKAGNVKVSFFMEYLGEHLLNCFIVICFAYIGPPNQPKLQNRTGYLVFSSKGN